MKKYLFILILFTATYAHAQSVNFSDLTNLAHLNSTEVLNYLTKGRTFKQEYKQDADGNWTQNFNMVTNKNRFETIMVGNGVIDKNQPAGLQTVSYATNYRPYVMQLLVQANKSGIKRILKGADNNNSVFIFDNDMYHVVINVNISNGSGSVNVRQKQFIGFNN